MKNPDPNQPPRLPSLADYLLRYDLRNLLEEAKLDYTQTSASAPRHLNQKDISARFRRPQAMPPPAEQKPNG